MRGPRLTGHWEASAGDQGQARAQRQALGIHWPGARVTLIRRGAHSVQMDSGRGERTSGTGVRWPGPGTARAAPGPPVVSGGHCGRGFWVSGRASAGARGGVALTLGSALHKEISGRRAACRRVEPLEDSKSWVAHHRTWQGPGQSLGGRLMGCVPPPGCPRAAGRLCVHAVQLHADVTVGTWGSIRTCRTRALSPFKRRCRVRDREEIRFYLLETELLEEGEKDKLRGPWGHPSPSPPARGFLVKFLASASNLWPPRVASRPSNQPSPELLWGMTGRLGGWGTGL